MSSFLNHYTRIITEAIPADFRDNHDADRFGPQPAEAKPMLGRLRRILARVGLVTVGAAQQTMHRGLGFVVPHLADLEWLYGKLADNESRELLARLTAYRSLGGRKIKLMVNNPQHWKNLKIAETLIGGNETIDTGFMNIVLKRINLEKIGYPIELFFSPAGIVVDFIERQYRCETKAGPIECESGDFVVDAGGCWGDTALLFAHQSGPCGRVASFEFLPDNLSIFRRNLELNPKLAERIRLYEHPVWSQSSKELLVVGSGPGTQVVAQSTDPGARKVQTFKIDELVARGDFPRIDFIKMDIEGAEMEALKGSESVLCKFKPKLAITVYHQFEHFWTVPQYLESLDVGYRFYLRHFTIHSEETVLFAVSNQRS